MCPPGCHGKLNMKRRARVRTSATDARGTYRNKALDEIVSFLVLGNQIEHVHARRQSCMIRIVFREGNSNASGLWVVASVDGIWKTEDFHNDGPGDRMKTYIEQQLGSVVPIRGTHQNMRRKLPFRLSRSEAPAPHANHNSSA